MKCRAKMVDGSPVTFDMVDCGSVAFIDGPRAISGYMTEFSGEGFYVRSVTPLDITAPTRMEADAAALRLSGVDTATAGYWEDARAREPNGMNFRYTDCWVPLFPRDTSYLEALSHPPTLTAEYAAAAEIRSRRIPPGENIYTQGDPTPAMLHAGIEAARLYVLHYSPVSRGFLSEIWRAMEKAKQ